MSNHLRVRQGGSVLRFHTWPCVRQQSVAAHTWGVLALIYALVDEPSPALVRRAVFHDLAEYDTGDIPSSAKWASAELKKMMDKVEDHFNKMHDFPGDDTLTRYELDVLKMADLLDMLWYCYEEYMIGNRGLKVVYVRVLHAIAQRHWVMDGDYRLRADAMIAELEQLWLATSDSEPS